jgi:hypothetical protein
MRREIGLLALFVFGLFTELLAGATNILLLDPSPTVVVKYQCYTVDFALHSWLKNPFDPKEIKIDLVIQTPHGQTIWQPAFCYHIKEDTTFWQARFTPTDTGRYSGFIQIQTPEHVPIQSKTFSVMVSDSDFPGFIHLQPTTAYHFQFDSGEPWRGFGENVCWTENYSYYFQKLHQIGANFARIWLCPWNFALEWQEPGLGRYHLDHAAQLDTLLALAAKYQIYLMFCLEYHGVARRGEGYFKENKWPDNPYNAKNGGPCSNAAELFTNPQAKQYYQKRLRYLVARYSYSPYLLAWEFWNEVDLTAGERDAVVVWHQEMATYLKQLDPIST